MLTYPQIDPVALSLGPLELFGKTIGPLNIHWYGLMYLFGITGAWYLAVRRSVRKDIVVQKDQVEDLTFYVAMGVVLGARVGYMLFYQFPELVESPLSLFKVWDGGMSFHGGLLGVIIATVLYCRKIKRNVFDVIDFFCPFVPIGLGLGRLGNFIGGELYGRATDVSWAMVFPTDPQSLARHPSQLYQAFLEGLVLFIIMYWFSRKPRPRAAVCSLFIAIYGCFRFFIEFFREPDSHIGYDLFEWMTRGQILSLPMIIIGVSVFLFTYKNHHKKQAVLAK